VTGPDAEVIVIGAGLVGAAAAWAMTRRGAGVLMLEGRRIGHQDGSSHGSSRIFRRAYPEAEYAALTGRAQALWAELGDEVGEPLLHRTGGVDHGAGRQLGQIKEAFDRHGVPNELIAEAEAEARWPGMRFTGDVLFHPEAGVINADQTVRALTTVATARGAELREQVEVTDVRQSGVFVEVVTSDEVLRARRVVVAAGAWVAELLPAEIASRFPEYTVTQQQVFHFPRRDPDIAWPVVIHRAGETAGDEVYALPSGSDGGAAPAFKVAEHELGVPTTARSRDFVVDPASRQRMVDYVQRWLPGLVPEVAAEITCLYTTTADRDFVLDRVDGVVVASACSGHGAKFAPVTGELIADLALTDAPTSPRFGLHPRRGKAESPHP
jgi:sarcosine oxidase